MRKLALVFVVWLASTAYAGLGEVQEDHDVELIEAYVAAWNEASEAQRRLLERSQRAWNEYRRATCALLGHQCAALMAQERAAQLRQLHRLTESNVRTILPAHGRADRREQR